MNKQPSHKHHPAALDHPALQDELNAEAQRRSLRPYVKRSLAIQFGIFIVLLALWGLPLANPIKLLLVLFHECSHLMAAYLTGGTPFGIAVHPAGAGVTLGIGGNELIVALAGYFGSFLLGFALYYLSAKWESADLWLVLLILCCLSLFFGWLNDFTAVFGYGAITLMIVGQFLLRPHIKTFFVRVLATASCLYPIIDVLNETVMARGGSLTVNGVSVGSDIYQIAQISGWSQGFLGFLWIGATIPACAFLIIWSAHKDAETTIKRRFFRTKIVDVQPLYRPNDPNSIREYHIK